MPLTYRSAKGAPLTFEEVDANFKELLDRVQRLEESPPAAEGIAALLQEGDQLIVKGTRGTSFGPFTLPKIFWKSRGRWQNNTPYALMDVVARGPSLWLCTSPHVSADEGESSLNWQEIFAFPTLEEPAPVVEKKGTVAPPCEKENLPQNPDLGQMVFVINAPKNAEIYYWEGKKWCSLSTHTPLEEG